MSPSTTSTTSLAFALAASLAWPTPISAQGGVEAGILTCESVPGTRVNLLIHSRVDVTCVFEMTGGQTERYRGTTGIGLGLDLNWNRRETMHFTVMTGGQDVRPGAHVLAGYYGGGKASITAGGGIGAAALIGGSSDHIALQPIAFEHSTGLGLSGGLTWLELEAAGGGAAPSTGSTER